MDTADRHWALEATAATWEPTVELVAAMAESLRLPTEAWVRRTAVATTLDHLTEVWPTLTVPILPLILKLTSRPTEDTAAWAALTEADPATTRTLTWAATGIHSATPTWRFTKIVPFLKEMLFIYHVEKSNIKQLVLTEIAIFT